MLEFEEDCEGVKEEIIDAGQEKGNELSIILHTPSKYNSLNKRDLSKIDIMDVCEENSNKRLNTQPKREMTMHDEKSVDDEKKVLFYINIMYK